MKLNISDVQIESDLNVSEFTFSNPEKIMYMFSTTFYKKPLESAITEILMNAADEHLKYNVKESVYLTYNEFSDYVDGCSEIVIRDYGKGLTEEEVKEIYTTFFKSTKEQSNTQWGCFGLGSKSPFAVNDTFVVRSFTKDKIETYVLTLVNNVKPVYTKIKEEENIYSDTGLEVRIQIPRSKYNIYVDDIYRICTNVYICTSVPVKFIQTDSVKHTKPIISSVYFFKTNDLELHIGYNLLDRYYENMQILYSGRIYKYIHYDIDHKIMSLLDKLKMQIIIIPQIGTIDLISSRENIIINDKFYNLLDNVNDILSKIDFIKDNEEYSIYKRRYYDTYFIKTDIREFINTVVQLNDTIKVYPLYEIFTNEEISKIKEALSNSRFKFGYDKNSIHIMLLDMIPSHYEIFIRPFEATKEELNYIKNKIIQKVRRHGYKIGCKEKNKTYKKKIKYKVIHNGTQTQYTFDEIIDKLKYFDNNNKPYIVCQYDENCKLKDGESDIEILRISDTIMSRIIEKSYNDEKLQRILNTSHLLKHGFYIIIPDDMCFLNSISYIYLCYDKTKNINYKVLGKKYTKYIPIYDQNLKYPLKNSRNLIIRGELQNIFKYIYLDVKKYRECDSNTKDFIQKILKNIDRSYYDDISDFIYLLLISKYCKYKLNPNIKDKKVYELFNNLDDTKLRFLEDIHIAYEEL